MRAATRNTVGFTRRRGFAADVGHELRTPLTTLKAELELAGQPGRTREELTAAVAAAAQDTDLCAGRSQQENNSLVFAPALGI
ncbi:histidine kinase dimerization/phospho-acceptor domain-containing protein [Streptomyces sp. NPDC051020]|uniref:histidine kinase dimerization/phospho-acceptor domain-containing protein n=1 Tax=Streptomyces sp. NPDC051020 TaxID=3155409 RepID=UPI003446E27E